MANLIFQRAGHAARAVGSYFSNVASAIAGGQSLTFRSDPYDDPRPVRLTEEKIRSGPSGVKLPWFLPYFDEAQQTGETRTMRMAYRRMMADPDIKAGVQRKLFSVMSNDAQFHPAKKKDPTAQLHADYCDWQFSKRLKGGMFSLIWDVLIHALIDGYSVNEKVWGLEMAGKWEGKHVLRALKPKDTNNDVVLRLDEYRNIVDLMALRYNQGEKFDPADFVIYTHLGMYGNPGGTSDFLAVYKSFWILDTVTKLRAWAADHRWAPFIKGTFPATDPAKQKTLNTALALIRSQNYLSVPDDIAIEAVNLAGSSEEFWASFSRELRERITIGISGSILSAMTSGAGQQRGDTKTHKDTADLIPWALSTSLGHVMNDAENGLIKEVIDRNFAGVTEYPFVSFGGIDEAELAESLKVDTGLAQIGWKFSIEEMEERYGRKFSTDPADTLVAPAAPPGASPSPNGTALAERNGHTNGVLKLPAPGSPAQPFRFAEAWRRYSGNGR